MVDFDISFLLLQLEPFEKISKETCGPEGGSSQYATLQLLRDIIQLYTS